MESGSNQEQEASYDNIFILRHGERSDRFPHLKSTYPNKEDPTLTSKGYQQCQETARFIKSYLSSINSLDNPLSVYTSPFLRCLQSTEAVLTQFSNQDDYDKRHKVTIDTRLCEIQIDLYFNMDPLPNLTVNSQDQVKEFLKESNFYWNKEWYDEGRSYIKYPECYRQLEARFNGFMKNEILEKQFKDINQSPKNIIVISHGCAIEQLAEYFGGRQEFCEEYCALVGFRRQKFGNLVGQWEQVFAGRAYYKDI